jgi:hypothetical protein
MARLGMGWPGGGLGMAPAMVDDDASPIRKLLDDAAASRGRSPVLRNWAGIVQRRARRAAREQERERARRLPVAAARSGTALP